MIRKETLIRTGVIATLLTALAVLPGCREEEQGRPLAYKKGTYIGKADQKLTTDQEQELRSRARQQAF